MYEQEENEEKEIQKRQNIFIISYKYLKKIVKKIPQFKIKMFQIFFLLIQPPKKGDFKRRV